MAYSNFYAHWHSLIDKIKTSFGAIFHFVPSLVYMGLVIIGQILAWFQVWFIHRQLSENILVLHYNVDFGIDLVSDPIFIYLYPLLGLGVFFLNFIILAIFHKDKHFKILVHYLLGAAAVFGAFLSIALLAVFLINFR